MENEVLETTEETVPETTEVLESPVETLETVPEDNQQYDETTEATEEVVVQPSEPSSPLYETITVQQAYEMTDAVIHADLFGSFLICGCLMALALFRRFK